MVFDGVKPNESVAEKRGKEAMTVSNDEEEENCCGVYDRELGRIGA
jgi:hypothetical protein